LRRRVEAYQAFLRRQGHRVGPYPGALLPVAHSLPADDPVYQDAVARERRDLGVGRPWLRRLSVPPTDPHPALLRTLVGHGGEVPAVALSGDGRTAASGAEDGTVRLWDVTTGECARILRGHEGGVTAVALSGDGRTAASGSVDGTVRLWDV